MRILVFDDDTAIGRLVVRIATMSGVEAMAVTDAKAFGQRLLTDPPQIVMLDLQLGDTDGVEQMRLLAVVADVPVIFVTGLGDQEAEIRGLSLGAIDYITKPISPVIVRARVRNHIELKRMRDELAALAVTDALTGLSNRRRLEQSLKVETERLARTADFLSVIMLDIDFFSSSTTSTAISPEIGASSWSARP